jgi:Family of unknown function (DUF6228)
MDIVDIKSCESRVTLSFAVHSRHKDEIRFVAKISGAPFTGEVLASTYFKGPPTSLFDDMAACWTGWSGQKSWEAIDGELSLTATTTSLGKVTLLVRMNADSGDYTATAVLKLEAGSLDRIAGDVRSLFSA